MFIPTATTTFGNAWTNEGRPAVLEWRTLDMDICRQMGNV